MRLPRSLAGITVVVAFVGIPLAAAGVVGWKARHAPTRLDPHLDDDTVVWEETHEGFEDGALHVHHAGRWRQSYLAELFLVLGMYNGMTDDFANIDLELALARPLTPGAHPIAIDCEHHVERDGRRLTCTPRPGHDGAITSVFARGGSFAGGRYGDVLRQRLDGRLRVEEDGAAGLKGHLELTCAGNLFSARHTHTAWWSRPLDAR